MDTSYNRFYIRGVENRGGYLSISGSRDGNYSSMAIRGGNLTIEQARVLEAIRRRMR